MKQHIDKYLLTGVDINICAPRSLSSFGKQCEREFLQLINL